MGRLTRNYSLILTKEVPEKDSFIKICSQYVFGILISQPVYILLLSRLMRQRCFWNSEEGVTSCWSWGPNPALDNQCTMVKNTSLA